MSELIWKTIGPMLCILLGYWCGRIIESRQSHIHRKALKNENIGLKRIARDSAELVQELAATRLLLGAEIGYKVQLEGAVREFADVDTCQALLECRPPEDDLMKCIENHDWKGFSRILQGRGTETDQTS